MLNLHIYHPGDCVNPRLSLRRQLYLVARSITCLASPASALSRCAIRPATSSPIQPTTSQTIDISSNRFQPFAASAASRLPARRVTHRCSQLGCARHRPSPPPSSSPRTPSAPSPVYDQQGTDRGGTREYHFDGSCRRYRSDSRRGARYLQRDSLGRFRHRFCLRRRGRSRIP
jgi:hypothetical protein